METLIATLFISASVQFDLPPGLLSSLCFVESRHEVTAIHKDDGGSDSIGICQIKLSTARWLGFRGNERQLMDPKINIYYAAAYLSHQFDRYNGDFTKAVIAYNIGHAKHLRSTEYSRRVIKQWQRVNRGENLNAEYNYKFDQNF